MVERERVEDYVAEDGAGRTVRITQYPETLPGGRKHLVLEASGHEGQLDNTPVHKVPARHSSAMRANPDTHLHSRVPPPASIIPASPPHGPPHLPFFSPPPSPR